MSNSENASSYFSLGDGTYLTKSQYLFLQNVLTSDNPYNAQEYIFYIDMCRIYNIADTLYKKDSSVCSFYWDANTESVSLEYLRDGLLSKEIEKIRLFSKFFGVTQ